MLVTSDTHLSSISRLVVLCQHGEIPYGHFCTPLRGIPDMTLHDIFCQDLDGNGTIGFEEVCRSPLPE